MKQNFCANPVRPSGIKQHGTLFIDELTTIAENLSEGFAEEKYLSRYLLLRVRNGSVPIGGAKSLC